MSDAGSVHPLAAKFGPLADTFEEGRPALPANLVDLLVEKINIGPHSRILELGAGTGKLTALLVGLGADLIVTEPLEKMRRTLERVVPGADIRSGSAERMPVQDASVDLVIAADAFHWFDRAATRGELLRVLVPTGAVVEVSVHRAMLSRWQLELESLLIRACYSPNFQPQTIVDMSPQWAWEQIVTPPEFGEIETDRLEFSASYTADRLASLVSSLHFVAALSVEERQRLLDKIGILLETHPETSGQIPITMDFRVEVSIARRTPPLL